MRQDVALRLQGLRKRKDKSWIVWLRDGAGSFVEMPPRALRKYIYIFSEHEMCSDRQLEIENVSQLEI